MRVTLFDYGAGNLHSLSKALAMEPGVEVHVEEDPRKAVDSDVLVLPGVGAFGLAAARLAPGRDTMRLALERGLPCLGICLGMQLLFDSSDEGAGKGLGYFAGHVQRLAARRVPQMGWNQVDEDSTLSGAKLDTVYYAHSFVCRVADPSLVTAWTTHEGDRFPAAVRRGKVVGVQFHPEKSSASGVAFVRAFLREVRS
ncbi:imidazole glycerol phosphate synthase subunit HisH [Myxococcus sp. K38C18041901]|uniref:imidazole glycerol phosphate synthase subunit HisH n=1 Tax=Myxococcus guangdongensis TaxID=2906760 RepID=UPI0020A7B60E|nr:imidazole glycerol phosphate synthase subunit HisH [Myxococcus guangdongensis]MCP3059865.1 imidazole glycerol phosphate synthase subunit HisH [Myxococcus guangdongensis]